MMGWNNVMIMIHCPGPRRHGPHGALPVGADDRPAARPDPLQTRVQSLQGDQ